MIKNIALLFVCVLARPSLAQVVVVDGSSTVYPITEAVAEEFQNEFRAKKYKVVVGTKGTGGGFKRFCRGETDVQDASRPILKEEIESCKKSGVKFIELPIAYDATVVAVHPKNDWIHEITVEELKKMWEPAAQGKIKRWNQVNAKWPDQDLKLFGAGSDSGTFDYFTEAVVGKAKASRGDYTASEDDNTLVQGISKDKNAIGYLPMAYFMENKSRLKALAIVSVDKKGKVLPAVLPGRETVENGTYAPLSRPIFIYVSQKSLSKPEVKEFTNFFLKNASTLVPSVQYVPLPAKAYEMATKNLHNEKLGTMFSGHSEVGLKIEELLAKETKF
ncbi:MAG: PstS family phosphate ABC transporter substrate-binding protein [Bdellovibrionaceae bacterium]|nr:PstS family phosphate ABC transporter substrate-binding protein [Pseudobdellovibrionaceae bacterium]